MVNKIKWNKALVTGGSGFIGSHIVDALVKKDVEVKVLDDLSSGFKSNLENVIDKIEFIKADIADFDTIKKVVSDIEVIFHLAANADVPKSVEDPILDFISNAKGTFNILNASTNSNVKKIIYASSAAIFGELKYLPIDEGHPKKPISPYGASKLSGELYGFAFQESFGIKFTALRIFNAIGPRQPRYVIYDFLNKLRKDKTKLEILGTGENIRDFIYVGDVVKAFINAAELSISDGQAYNLGTGIGISISDLAKEILKKLGLNSTKLEYTGISRSYDILKLVSKPDKAKEHLNIKNITSLSDALSDEINWFKEKVGGI